MKHLTEFASWIVILAVISIAAYAYAAIPKMPEKLPENLCRPTPFDGITVEDLIQRGGPSYGTVEQNLDLSE